MSSSANNSPECQLQYLPNELEDEHLEVSISDLATSEDRLREGQMRSALDSLRVHLYVRLRFVIFKVRHFHHQREN